MQDLSQRTKSFAVRIVKLFSSLPKTIECDVIGKQFLRSGTSVGAHYREAIRARSPSEFAAKIDVGLQELEETIYWIELLIETDIVKKALLNNLLKEADELTAILVTMSKNTKKLKS